MKNIIKQYKIILPSIIIGLLAGWLLFQNGGSGGSGSDGDKSQAMADGTMWTCSMHPQIKQDKFGLCPICAMDLIPLEVTGSEEEGVDPNEVMMTASAAKLAEIQTYIISQGAAVRTIHLQGKVVEDERNISEVTARFGARIEELHVNFTGQKVRIGQKLASVYSPELISAQKELLEAKKIKDSRPALYQASRSKLLYWNLSEDQILSIENKGEIQSIYDILSPINGTVTMRHVALGDYVKEGQQLFKVVDLSRLWIQLDAYESDLPWIKLNQEVSFELRAVPGKMHKARVAFIDPTIDAKTRVAKIRLDISNSNGELKPEMFVSALLEANLTKTEDKLMVPKTAVLWTGKRSLVYVKVPDRESPSFLMREVTLGADAGEYYVIESGLNAGEEIVVNGVFKVDASAHLRGLVSMMNPGGGMPQEGHQHGEEQGGSNIDPTHENHVADNLGDEPTTMPQDLVEEHTSYDVDPLFKLQLTELYSAYLPMKDAFVLTKSKKVRKAAKILLTYLEAMDMQLLEGEAHTVWMDQVKQMKRAVDKIIETKDIEMQRTAFSDFNGGFYEAVKSFGLEGEKVYYQFCPMAFNDQGAYWLSSEEQIANPYFGDVMLRCGEVKEIIED